jgi:hypothetical protein
MMAATYKAQIQAWDWEKIEAHAEETEDIEGNRVRSAFLGTVFALTPSGKFYTPWARSNVTVSEARKDEKWFEALEAIAEKRGAYITGGEGDPCDLFAVWPIEEDPDG